MFCVIQEIINKRDNPPGYPKRLELTSYKICAEDGTEQTKWGYFYSEECFERPVKKSYKVSIHQSYRDKEGKPRKKQYNLFTVKYYDLAMGQFDTYNWGGDKIEKVAAKLDVAQDDIYEAVESKIKALELQIEDEFLQTEESQTHRKHLETIWKYESRKRQFNMEYRLRDSDDFYDYCYDVFGNLRNPEMLELIQREYLEREKARKREEKQRQENFEKWFRDFNWKQFESRHFGSSSYQKYNSDNYKSSDGSYHSGEKSTYTDEQKAIRKKFLRVLEKNFHPDSNIGKDTTKEMLEVYKVREEWGLG